MTECKVLVSALNKCVDKYNKGVSEHGGGGLADSGLSKRDLLIMLQEEHIDAIMYIEALLMMEESDAKS